MAAKAVKAIARHNGVTSLTDRNTTNHTMDAGTFVSVPVHDISHHEEEDEEAPFMLETRNNMKDRQYRDVFEHGSVAMVSLQQGGAQQTTGRLYRFLELTSCHFLYLSRELRHSGVPFSTAIDSFVSSLSIRKIKCAACPSST